MSWIEAFAPIEAKYRADIAVETWGHLAPRRRKAYQGSFVFAIPEYDSGNPCIVSAAFEGLGDSPWLYDAMQDFAEQIIPRDGNGLNPESGVYRFDGTFRNYEFKGTVMKICTDKV